MVIVIFRLLRALNFDSDMVIRKLKAWLQCDCGMLLLLLQTELDDPNTKLQGWAPHGQSDWAKASYSLPYIRDTIIQLTLCPFTRTISLLTLRLKYSLMPKCEISRFSLFLYQLFSLSLVPSYASLLLSSSYYTRVPCPNNLSSVQHDWSTTVLAIPSLLSWPLQCYMQDRSVLSYQLLPLPTKQ